ncbi:galactosyldiacylglycerol synthase [Candidatus Acetothermia bacterium]|nr:galactosyldiacylglycerol synthase [Candidatus Acetothermia bacterium]MBI3461251.1 galactosyldiacylglycerol synthase [Candidatus Acetothermia bacterium]MBI3659952.1 galactosyldiacylglycerol synthase [Candidatus Acetothermia bacterium]
MIQLFTQDPETRERELLGAITEEQLQFLVDHLEEEFEEDKSYYIDHDTADYLQETGADDELIHLLEKGLLTVGDEEGIEIAYERH